jgi:hypothetical protein
MRNIEAFDFVISELDKRARMNMSGAIDTDSNLTSKAFANIAHSQDIATTAYETKFWDGPASVGSNRRGLVVDRPFWLLR